MLHWIIGVSLKFRYIMVAIALGLFYYGILLTRELPVDILPEFSEPFVEVQTEALGLSAAEVEALITVPLEADMLNGAPWLKEIRSQSIPGLSSIVLVFEPGTNVLRARQMVMERLTEVFTLPNVSKPPVIVNPVSSAGRVLMIGLSSKKLSPIDISVLARWTVAPRLMGVEGVANVSVWGERRRQLQVQVDPARLKELDIRLQQVIKTAGNALWYSPLTFLDASTPGTSGFIDTPNQRLGVRHRLPIRSADELAQVPVEDSGKRLGEVATVVEDHQPLIGDVVVNGEPNILLVVEKFPWANTTSVTMAVEKALDALRPGLVGLEIDPTLFRPATYIKSATGNLLRALLIAGALIVVSLGLFLMEARAACIAAAAIAISYLVALIVLDWLGVTINAMVLAGLAVAIGVVVNDAISNVYSIATRLRKRRRDASAATSTSVVQEAALELRGTLIFATVVLLLMVAPVYFVGGIEGVFLRAVATAYAAITVASMLVALTVVPVLSALLLPKLPVKEDRTPTVKSLQQGYNSLLSRLGQSPKPVFIVVSLLAVLGWALLLSLKPGSLKPRFNERDLLVEVEHAPGTSPPAMSRIMRQAADELKSIPGVRSVSGHLGRAVLSDKVNNVNRGQLWISLGEDANYGECRARVRQVMDGFPGVDIDTLTYLQGCVEDPQRAGAEGVSDEDIVVRVYGDRWDVLREKALEVKKTLLEIDGIVYAEAEAPMEEPQVEIEVNMEAAQKHGIKPGDVRRAVTTLVSGLEVGYLFEQQKVFDVVVWGAPEVRKNITSIQNLLIDTPSGQVPLKEVASVRVTASPIEIRRETVARYIDVAAQVNGRNVASVSEDVEHRLKQISFPLEYRAEPLRSSADRLAARNELIAAIVAAAVGVFLVLQASVGSWRLAAALFVTLPASIVGCVVVALATGGVWTLPTLLGILAVLGIVVRDSLATIKHLRMLIFAHARIDADTNGDVLRRFQDGNSLLQQPVDADAAAHAQRYVEQGIRERFSPVVITAAVTAVALLPLVFMGDAPGSEILRPMAIVILGGLITAIAMTLVGVPFLYLKFTPKAETELEEFESLTKTEKELSDAVRELRALKPAFGEG